MSHRERGLWLLALIVLGIVGLAVSFVSGGWARDTGGVLLLASLAVLMRLALSGHGT